MYVLVVNSTYTEEYATKLHFCLAEASPHSSTNAAQMSVCAGAAARAQSRDVTAVFKMAAWNSRAYFGTNSRDDSLLTSVELVIFLAIAYF